MRPVKCDGKLIGYAVVEGERVVSLDLEEGWMSDLQKGEHEVTIELEPTAELDLETDEYRISMDYLSSKFTL